MSDLLKLIIILEILHNIIGFFILLYYESKTKINDDFLCHLNPLWLYENYIVNYFGCFILTILFNIACPLLSSIYWICKFIEWIMTVGRKQNDKR